MRSSTGPTYRVKFVVLAIVGILMVTIFWRQKVEPAYHGWQAYHAWHGRGGQVQHLITERSTLRSRSIYLDARLGRTDGPNSGWQPVFDLISGPSVPSGIYLSGVAEEHIVERSGSRIHTLPLSLEGGAQDLVNTIATIERKARGIHLLSVDLQARRPSYNTPRVLTATLYLQTFSE